MKNFMKIFSLLMIVSLVLISCGAPGAQGPQAADVDYKQTANEIRSLSSDLSNDPSDVEARRYLAQIEKLLQPATNAKSGKDLTIVPVNVKEVAPEYIAQKVQYLGDITGDPSVVVYPKLTDTMIDIYVENGSFVKEGTILATISDESVKSSVAQAEAAYLSARTQSGNVEVEYKRMAKLYKANAISDSQWDQIQMQRQVAIAGVKQAQAALDMAHTQLGYATIKAPISGYVSNLAYQPGDLTTPQKPFATIHQTLTVKLTINVTEYDLGFIREGQRTEISVNTYPDIVFEGKVKTVSPVIDPMTRTAKVEIIANNKYERLKPGMFARINIITHERENALTVNKSAVNKQTVLKSLNDNLREDKVVETYSCFIVRDGVALDVPIEIGIESKTKYEVTGGLSNGDLVVVMGQNNLSDSTMVKIVE